MNTSEKKTVTPQVHLQALALFTMAKQHADEMDRYMEGLKRLLGGEDGGGFFDYFQDVIFGGRNDSFDEAFRKAGFVVDEEKAA